MSNVPMAPSTPVLDAVQRYSMALLRRLRMFFHQCSERTLEYILISHVQDPNPAQNPLSIYGPKGSFWAVLHRCKICGRYGGQMRHTYGGYQIGTHEAHRLWSEAKQREREGQS